MYHIDSTKDKPNIDYMVKFAKSLMRQGIKTANLKDIYLKYLGEQERYKQDIQVNFGIVNPNSSKQVVGYLDSLCDPVVIEICCPDGKWTSNKEALAELDCLGYEFAGAMLKYRLYKKYAESIRSIMDSRDSAGCVHPVVTCTKTNRLSYSNPALMNIPKELLWKIVVSSKEGNTLISADIKNQEPNILINMCNAERLKPALKSQEGLYEAIFQSIPIKVPVTIAIDHGDTLLRNMKDGVMDNDVLREMGIREDFVHARRVPFPGIRVMGEEIIALAPVNIVSHGVTASEIARSIDTNARLEGDTWHLCVSTMAITVNEDEIPVRINVVLPYSNTGKRVDSGMKSVSGELQGHIMECIGDIRKEFKRAWNAISYGASNKGVEKMCRVIDGKTIYEFISSIEELQVYRKACSKQANSRNPRTKTYFGTELDAGISKPSILKRVLMDLPIQGTAADILSLLIMHFNQEVDNRGLKDMLSIYYTRHDELIIEADQKLVESVGIDSIKEIVKDIVEHQIDDWEPFKVDVSVINGREEASHGDDTINVEDEFEDIFI